MHAFPQAKENYIQRFAFSVHGADAFCHDLLIFTLMRVWLKPNLHSSFLFSCQKPFNSLLSNILPVPQCFLGSSSGHPPARSSVVPPTAWSRLLFSEVPIICVSLPDSASLWVLIILGRGFATLEKCQRLLEFRIYQEHLVTSTKWYWATLGGL